LVETARIMKRECMLARTSLFAGVLVVPDKKYMKYYVLSIEKEYDDFVWKM